MSFASIDSEWLIDPGESAASRVEHSLRDAIIRLELRPGTRLSEQDIADRLGTSRQPVREALIALAKSRLVKAYPKQGTYVAKISARMMMEARLVREAIETTIARRAGTNFDPWIRETIDAILDRQDAARIDQDHDRFQHEDAQFHIALARGAGCTLAWSIIADIKAHIDRVCNLQLRKPDSMAKLIAEHRVILEAIDARDPARAEQAMRTHLEGILSDLPQIEAEHVDLFEQT